ncbi:MAG TPA: adenine-specific DNA methylase [Candidatus Thermoplasmatota archaeon]|nr:adenine-specific DNA methylase [Candidatus Thermoplasmatota archaeon]
MIQHQQPVRQTETIMHRIWEMPNKWTFKMKCIQEILMRYNVGKGWADPFSGMYSPAEHTNDIEITTPARSHNDGLIFLKSLFANAFAGVIFDPPYSPEQCLRLYSPISRDGKKSWGTGGKATYHAECRDEISRIVKPNGIAISFGWDTNGIGKKRGFEIIEVLDICHGACHNDTLVTVEKKVIG